jgi:hypothetical protein
MLANHQNLVAKYGDFKRKKLKTCPNPPKNLADFVTFFLEIWRIFFENFQKLPLTVLLGTFFKRKMTKIHHKRIHMMCMTGMLIYLFIKN